jgi:hypothetical protein
MGSSNRHRKRPMIILDPSSASEEISWSNYPALRIEKHSPLSNAVKDSKQSWVKLKDIYQPYKKQ